jgi:hypothetical protein
MICYSLRIADNACGLRRNCAVGCATWRHLERDLKGLRKCSGREDQPK